MLNGKKLEVMVWTYRREKVENSSKIQSLNE